MLGGLEDGGRKFVLVEALADFPPPDDATSTPAQPQTPAKAQTSAKPSAPIHAGKPGSPAPNVVPKAVKKSVAGRFFGRKKKSYATYWAGLSMPELRAAARARKALSTAHLPGHPLPRPAPSPPSLPLPLSRPPTSLELLPSRGCISASTKPVVDSL